MDKFGHLSCAFDDLYPVLATVDTDKIKEFQEQLDKLLKMELNKEKKKESINQIRLNINVLKIQRYLQSINGLNNDSEYIQMLIKYYNESLEIGNLFFDC